MAMRGSLSAIRRRVRSEFRGSFRARTLHLLGKTASVTIGRVYAGQIGAYWRLRRDYGVARPQFQGKVALVAHAYYLDLLPEVVDCLANLPETAELIVTVPRERVAEAQDRLRAVERAKVVAVDNHGRDIGPFLSLLAEGTLDPYDVVLKIHLKRSPHLLDGDIRRRLLFAVLAGSRRRSTTVLKLFEDPTLGMAGWRPTWRNDVAYWMMNRARVKELAIAMGAAPSILPAFFEGSMFWVRPSALAPLRRLALDASNFEPEQGQLDGTLHHAVERAFTIAVGISGCAVSDLGGRILQEPMNAPSQHIAMSC